MPAIAASTCSQAPASWQIGAMSASDRRPSTTSCRAWRTRRTAVSPAARSAAIGGGERVGAHGERRVVLDDADRTRCRCRRCAAPSRCSSGPAPWRRRRAGMCRRRSLTAAAGRPPAGGEHGHQRGLARRALDDTAAGVARVAEPRREIEQLGHPVDDAQLQFGARRRGHPAQPVDAEPGRQQLAEDRGVGAVGREVGEEARVLPVDQPGHDDAVDVGEHVGEAVSASSADARGAAA